MRFPKDRNGFSPQGNKDARFIDESRVPFLTRRRPATAGHAGFVAKKKGEFLEVRLIPQLIDDGFYALGRASDVTRIVGSMTARGRFTDRGLAPAAGGFSVSQFAFYGQGLGQIYKFVALPNGVDFDGRATARTSATIMRSRTGRTLTDHYSFVAAGPLPRGTSFGAALGTVYDTPAVFQAVTIYPSVDATGQYHSIFVRDNGTTQQEVDVGYHANQEMGVPQVQRVGVQHYLTQHRYYRRHDITGSPTASSPADCPGVFWSFSKDAGATWMEVTSNEMLDDFQVFLDLPPTSVNDNPFNNAVGQVLTVACPLNPTTGLIYCICPYVDAFENVKMRVKLGLLDLVSGVVTQTQVLFDTTAFQDALEYWFHGVVPVDGGVLVLSLDGAASAGVENTATRIRFTTTGSDLTHIGYFPFATRLSGVITVLNKTTLFCPMFDGVYTLYESLDRGATWAPRAIISDRPVGGAAAGNPLLLFDFPKVTYLRNLAVPANATPGVPWASDSRIAFA